MSETLPATDIRQVGQFEYCGDIGKLFAALARAQAKGLTAEANQDNPAFKRKNEHGKEKPLKYADLDAVMEVFAAHVATEELSILSFPAATGKTVSVKTVLGHSSGAWMAGVFTAEAMGASAQNVAAAKTYLVRHNTCAITGITVGVPDDDGNEATGKDRDGVSLPRGNPGTMREHAQNIQQGQRHNTAGTVNDNPEPAPTRDAIPIWGADKKRYTAKPKGETSAIDVWIGFWRNTLNAQPTHDDVNEWVSKNERYLAFVRETWPQAGADAQKALDARHGAIDNFPGDTAPQQSAGAK